MDITVISKYCHACTLAKRDMHEDSPEFDVWFEGHKKECLINHVGSSSSMEMLAAEKIWKPSEGYGLRYTTMISVSDSKTFQHLKKLEVYGSDCVVNKDECINHVAKRLVENICKSGVLF